MRQREKVCKGKLRHQAGENREEKASESSFERLSWADPRRDLPLSPFLPHEVRHGIEHPHIDEGHECVPDTHPAQGNDVGEEKSRVEYAEDCASSRPELVGSYYELKGEDDEEDQREHREGITEVESEGDAHTSCHCEYC